MVKCEVLLPRYKEAGIFFNTLYYAFREIRAVLPGKATLGARERYPVLQVHAGSFRVSVI